VEWRCGGGEKGGLSGVFDPEQGVVHWRESADRRVLGVWHPIEKRVR
tara:strand:- start:4 stop:144 length:141 start_codon:yes stop_codon:yes gene_type:complete